MNSIEVCFSPALFDLHKDIESIVVVTDIFRATSSICTAFENGVNQLIPVSSADEARTYKEKGYTVAAERNAIVLPFADFGNSPSQFSRQNVEGRDVVYTTTNGTKTIMMAKECHAVVVGAFVNLPALNNWLQKQNRNILIVCSGWKNKCNIEDTVFAGAVVDYLLNNNYTTTCDSAKMAQMLWLQAKDNLAAFLKQAAQDERLTKKGLADSIPWCTAIGTTDAIPILQGNVLVNINRN